MLNPVRVGHDTYIRYGKNMNMTPDVPYDIREAMIVRGWFRDLKLLRTALTEHIKTPIIDHALVVAAQGNPVNIVTTYHYTTDTAALVQDPLRLFRATGIMALPTRALLRLLATAEDVTHS